MKIRYTLIPLAALLLSACTTEVRSVDPTDSSRQSLNIGQADVNATAKQMVDSMLASGAVARVTGTNPPPTIVVIPIRLDAATITDPRINTDAITTLVRGQVINSGLFQFVDATRRGDIRAELEYQAESGMVDPAQASAAGRQVGADYILEGTISGFDEYTGKTRLRGYVVTMTLQDLESGVILWQETKQIAKEQSKRLIGW